MFWCLQTNYSFTIVKSEELLFQLIENILVIPYIRYKSHKYLAQLLLVISQLPNIDKSYFLNYFKTLLFTQMKSIILLLQIDLYVFCRYSFVGLLQLDDIIQQMKAHSLNSTSSFSLFHFFSPDIRENDKTYYNKCTEHINFMAENVSDALNIMSNATSSFHINQNQKHSKALF